MSEKITILRVESADGAGPFRGSILSAMHAAMGDVSYDWHKDFPTSLDMFGTDSIGWVCGIETARELVTWFPAPMRDILAEFGYGVSTYRVDADRVRRADGAMQVIFDRKGGDRVHREFDDRFERRLHRKAARQVAEAAWAPCPAPNRTTIAGV